MPTTKRIFLFSLPLLALIVLGAVFYSSSSDAHPKERVLSVLWEPEEVTLTLAPGDTKTVQVQAEISCKHPKLFVEVSPELEPYVSIAPSVVDKCKKEKHRKSDNDDSDGRHEVDSSDDHRRSIFKKREWKERGVNTVIFDITTEIPANVDPQTFEGTIQLVSKKSSSETLPVMLNVWPVIQSDLYKVNYPPTYTLNTPTLGKVLLLNGVGTSDGGLRAPIQFFSIPLDLATALELIRSMYSVNGYVETVVDLGSIDAVQVSGVLDNKVYGWGGFHHTFVVVPKRDGSVLQVEYNSEDLSVALDAQEILTTLELL